MATEALTQYKLMILYLLHSVKYPLSNSRLSGFFLENEYTTYFTLQQCINDLVEASLISAEHSQSTTRYESTEEGKQTLNFFSQDIPELETRLLPTPITANDIDKSLIFERCSLKTRRPTTTITIGSIK